MRPLVFLGLFGACLQPSLVACPDGDRLCPIGDVCDTVHHTCITPEQQQACEGLADQMSCNLGGDVGTCLGGVCFVAVCGDGFVAPGEACDDGNRTSGDGCNATCASNEVCGNGTIDYTIGEQCDDGNTLAGDGCDSRCRPEQETWTVIGVRPEYDGGSGHTVYDPIHHQTIHVVNGITWTWDGTRWTVLASTGLDYSDWTVNQVVWDSERNRVVLVGALAGYDLDQIWDWDGAAWTRVVIAGASPTLGNARAVYDRARHGIVVVGSLNVTEYMWTFDFATRAWTHRIDPPIGVPSGSVGFAYDETRSVSVFVEVSATTRVTEWNGTSWSAFNTVAMPTTGNMSIAYDPRLAAVIALGGSTTAVSKWTGAAWTQLAAEAMPAAIAAPNVWFDTDRQRRIAIGASDQVYEWDGSAWSLPPETTPPNFTYAYFTDFAYDYKRGELLVYGGAPPTPAGTDLWAFDGTSWRRLPQSPVPENFYPGGNSIVYDPVRDAIVLSGSDKGTYLLHDEVWTTLEPAGTSATGGMLPVFDPLHRQVLGLTAIGTWSLPSDGGAHWTKLTTTGVTPSLPATIAFDVNDHNFLVSGGTSGATVFDGTTFALTLSPGSDYSVVGDQRRGTVELLNIGATNSSWEHRGGLWYELPGIPIPISGLPVYDPRGAQVLIGGTINHSRLILKRTFIGTSPLEKCTGNDDDGDGLVDCADPDCYWSCTPACPPHVTCP